MVPKKAATAKSTASSLGLLSIQLYKDIIAYKIDTINPIILIPIKTNNAYALGLIYSITNHSKTYPFKIENDKLLFEY